MKTLKSIEELIDAFHKLPGIGLKTAEKLAYGVLKMDGESVNNFSKALKDVKTNIRPCPICGNYTEDELCEFCSNINRDKQTIIVVSSPLDIPGFEKIGTYKGVYHVLGGTISALSGVDVDDLNISSLLNRIKNDQIKEIILATNPTIDGETTALYIAKLLENEDVKVSRLAYGLPIGGHLEYADSLTLSKALEGRKNY